MLHLIDLVIGAFESQAVFALRSRPVAVAQINVTTSEIVTFNSYQCLYNNLSTNW